MDNEKCDKCQLVPASWKAKSNRRLCGDCFAFNVGKKFRFILTKKLELERGARILVAYSGGAASSVLLDQLCSAVHWENGKRLFYDIAVVHVDDLGVLNALVQPNLKESFNVDSKLDDIRDRARLVCKENKFEFIPVSLGEFSPSSPDPLTLLRSVQSTQQRSELFRSMVRRCIASVAKKYEYEIILSGQTSDQLAIDALAMITRGKGMNVPQSVQLTSSWYGKQVGYPMRNTLKRECTVYCQVKHIPTFFYPNFSTMSSGNVEDLCEKFIYQLQNGYESTIPNVLRTLGKLKTIEGIACSICGCTSGRDICEKCGSMNLPKEWIDDFKSI